MEVLDLSDFNRIDEMSRLILGRLFLLNLIQGGGGLRCYPKEGRIEILGTAEKDLFGSFGMSEVNVVDEVTSALSSLGLVGGAPGAPTSILLRINDLETVVTLVPPDVEQADAFDLQFQASAEICEAARSVHRQETPQDLWIREGRIVRRVAASPYTVPQRLWTAPLRLFAVGFGKLFGKPT